MNKTISINISGIIFNIEEDAYATLKDYLETISSYFSESDGKHEIMEDIEARIAELLQERRPGAQVVTPIDVDEVMTIMGRPEDYVSDGETQTESTTSERRQTEGKKLYLDVDNKIIAGVCAGIGAYLGWNPVWVRIIFIACALGFWFFTVPLTILVYILIWMIVPQAKTTAEKLEMQGKAVTVDSIKKKVDESLSGVSESFSNMDTDGALTGARKGVSKGVDGLLAVLGAIFSGLARVFGFFLLLSGVLGITALLASALQPDVFLGGFSFSFDQMIEAIFKTTSQAVLFIFGLATQTIIPLVVIALIGLSLAFRPKYRVRPIAITLFLVWIVGLAALLIAGIGMGTDFQTHADVIKSDTAEVSKNQVTYIGTLGGEDGTVRYGTQGFLINDNILSADDHSFVCNGIDVRLEAGEAGTPIKYKVQRYARGRDNRIARERAENIVYESTFSPDSILLGTTFSCMLTDKFRDQEVEIDLFIPIGHSVYIDESTKKLWRTIDMDDDDLRLRDVMGKRWTMGKNGLYEGPFRSEPQRQLEEKERLKELETDSLKVPPSAAI